MQKRKFNKSRSVFAVFLATVLVALSVPGISAKAAGYTGSGTMADPYLVQTAEQLQGMRDNLSAHYKLANTIDLSGVDFKPIGRLDAPFTGSFVCELNADNTPKFAIKNLKIAVAETPYASENKCKWEAAMFGATSGATISGIYVLDAHISNQVLGDNTGAVQYGDYKPGMDEMNSAILIGQADNTMVMNCGVTGEVKTRANHSAGLIGYANNATIEKCYSTANVTSEGKWNIGGLLGTGKNTTITACFATGNVSGSQSNIGGFVGSGENLTVTDCYASGNVSGGKEGKTSFSTCKGSTSLTNCYALGTVSGDGSNKNIDAPSVNNCWGLSGKTHCNDKLQLGSLAQIKAAFANLPSWDTSGNQPQLKEVGVVTDASKYTPQTVSQPSGGTTGTEQAGTTAGEAGTTTTTTTIDGTAQTGAKPEDVMALIEKLPNPEEDGNVTIKDKDAIKEAWNAYESMSTGDKDSFDAIAFAKLADCRYQVSLLIVGDWITSVEALPDKEDLTLDDIDNINELWSDYQFMDESILQSSSKYDKLKEKIEAAHEYAEENANVLKGEVVEVENGLTKGELVLVIVCLTMFVMILTFEFFVILSIIKRNKKTKKEVIQSGEKA